MRVKSLILENFRIYRERIEIPFSGLTAFIGRNDVGKSSIVEAMDIFFEGGTVKIEKADASIRGDEKSVRIGVVFDELPEQLILDSKVNTSLSDEYLLNPDGDLEIHKVYDCSTGNPKSTIHSVAKHPSAADASKILQLSQTKLRQMVKDLNLESQCNKSENPSMRKAIYQSFDDLNLTVQDVPLNLDNGKAIWEALRLYLPMFALFQSDRPSKDQDPEVQNPMKAVIAKALKGLEKELEEITSRVHAEAQERAQKTIEKLAESYPGMASTLEPRFKKASWPSVFKLDLESDDGVPLNKRGSGVRRLVLMSFFQAEADKLRNEAKIKSNVNRRVIYAVEEPETSQHPDTQKMIIDAFNELANAGEQVVITTHVPALAAQLPLDSLRFVHRESHEQAVEVQSGDQDEKIYNRIADTLGVLPDPISNQSVKVAVLVEGTNDIAALKSMLRVLENAGIIESHDEEHIFWTIGGGDSSLIRYVQEEYLFKLKLPLVMIIDSDRVSSEQTMSRKKEQWLNAMESKPDVQAFVTRKRNIENYIHVDALMRVTNPAIKFPPEIDQDFDSIAQQIVCIAKSEDKKYKLLVNDGRSVRLGNDQNVKQFLSSYVFSAMSAEELLERGKYSEGDGEKNEIREWIDAILKSL